MFQYCIDGLIFFTVMYVVNMYTDNPLTVLFAGFYVLVSVGYLSFLYITLILAFVVAIMYFFYLLITFFITDKIKYDFL